jgi:PAS domain S-box-containing protein
MAGGMAIDARPLRPRLAASPYWVLLLGLLATAAATWYAGTTAATKDRLRLSHAAEQTRDTIEDRLQRYIALLRAGAGLFAAAGDVSRPQFRSYVERLELQERYPGIQGIGFSLRVQAGELGAAMTQIRQGGAPDFRIWPEHARAEYHTIVYLEPLDRRNRAAIGYDMFSEPVRRAAMERARDTGGAAASGKLTLVQEIDERKQPGFLIYLPVFADGRPARTVEERRAALRGFVFSPFRAGDLLAGIFPIDGDPLVDFEVFDGLATGPEQLLHRSGGTPGDSLRVARSVIEVAGRPWTVLFTPRPRFDTASTRDQVPLVALAGLAISLVLFGLARSQADARAAAERGAADLRQSEEALRESESRLRRIVDSNVVGILIADFAGRIVEANDAFLALVGHTRADLESGAINWTEMTPPEYRELDEGAMTEMRRAGRHAPFEKEYVRKDGSRVSVLVGAAHLGGPDDLVAAIILDLTERKRAERERERLLERAETARHEAEAASRLKDEFLATVSHELRTPLTAMLGWARLLRTGSLDAAATARAIEVIDRNAQVQVRLVNDLLEVSGIVTGKLRLDVRQVDVATVIEGAMDSVRPGAAARGLRLEARLASSVPPLLGDRERLQQVVWNLLSNAIKFTDTGGQILVTLAKAAAEVTITVRDTGQGITREFLPYVFDRFRQSDSSITRVHGGLGLGLALVRHIVELHGGRVSAYSAGPGKGATFTVTLPAADSRTAASIGTASARGAETIDLHGLRVLLVEDEPDALDFMATLLAARGAAVRAVASVSGALEALADSVPDIVVSDIGMPGSDGYGLMRAVRDLPPGRGGDVPAVAVTAYAAPEDRERAMSAGYDEYIAKPIEPDALLRVVVRLTLTRRPSAS